MRDVPLYAVVAILLFFIALPTANSTTYAVGRPSAEVVKEGYTQSGCTSDPYAFLEQRHPSRGNPNSTITPTTRDKGIDAVFACRLMKLMEFAESKGCRVTINSAQRNKQTCNPGGGACARQGNSCHQYGLAVDIGGSGHCLQWVTSIIGRKNRNSPFGVHVAYQENGPYRHLQCIEHLIANASNANGCRSSCDGKTPISFDTSGINGPGSPPPTSKLSDMFRNALYGQQQPPPPPPPPQTPPQTLSPSQQPTNYFPTTEPPVTVPSTTKDYYSQNTQSQSIADQLLQLAYGTTSYGQITNATTVPIVVSGKDAADLQGAQTATTSTQQVAQLSPTYQAPETFTSGGTGYSGSVAPPQTGFLAILAQLKEALVRLLDILRPFGIREAVQGEADIEHAE